MKILIIGGYGTFGGRLADLLGDLDTVTLLIGGRSRDKADDFCRRWQGRAAACPVLIDRGTIAVHLAQHTPDLVVDASGPFQAYGRSPGAHDPYSVVRACLAAGVSYLDFADGSEFVAGIDAFDDQAKLAGVYVLSGASSFPVLTGAVLQELGAGMNICKVTAGIAPSPYAGMSTNVMRAVLGYAGGPVILTRGGRLATAPGLAESLRYTIAPPGVLPLRSLRFSLVDVPDLRALPARHPEITGIWVGAAPLPEFLHRALNVLARVRARFGMPALTRFAPLFRWVLERCRFGEHRGGMFVEIAGERDGHPVTRAWHMIAEGDDGPMIPSMAIEAIVRKTLAGSPPASGARAALGELTLDDYRALFAVRRICEGTRSSSSAAKPLYPALLGSAYKALPPQVRALHGSSEPRVWSGTGQVRRGRNPLARLLAWIYGFPPATDSIPVRVEFTPKAGGELWQRSFGAQRFHSHQSRGTGRNSGLLAERFGPASVGLA